MVRGAPAARALARVQALRRERVEFVRARGLYYKLVLEEAGASSATGRAAKTGPLAGHHAAPDPTQAAGRHGSSRGSAPDGS